ncbi:unnamed protein product [Tetraodon nigroviridis]|uniref:(spotted green pufferfish) hypothetical protein n=1 Tax=Tetraodon nigroviridis TaxID=99883 RepID=Q4SPM0_TETNG|nr:unnamed protein product [Tetraodon nigroviridis]
MSADAGGARAERRRSGRAAPRCRGRYAELQSEFASAVQTSVEQKTLILKLEHDLSTVQALSSLPRPDAEGSEVGTLENIPEPVKEATAMFAGSGPGAPAELPQGQMDSLLSIISSQRERFRSRNQELEVESRSMQQTLQALQAELDSLRADNIKLYEKIKFLQSYPGRAGGSDDTVMRYSSQYEERLDPFASFSRKERQRRYLSLSPWDKATLSLVGATLGSAARPLLRVSSSAVCLSGSCNPLQQDGADRGLLLHPVPALFGVPGRAAVSGPAPGSPQSQELTSSLPSAFRCYTRRRGARVSAETAPLSVLKSEFIRPQSLFCSFRRRHVSSSSIVFVFPTGTPTISTSSTRMTRTSEPGPAEAGLAARRKTPGRPGRPGRLGRPGRPLPPLRVPAVTTTPR